MVLKSLILLLVALGFTSSQQMTCTYSIVTTNKYQCALNINNPDGLDNAVSIGGVHSGSDGSHIDDYGNLISNSTYNDSSVQIVRVIGITKNIPSAICRQFPNVEKLIMFAVGIQIVTATKCSKLTEFHLTYNSLEQSSLPDLCQFQPALQRLDLNNNKLKAIPDITLKSCKNLVYLYADNNQISALSSTLFASTPKIESISFGSNPISVIPSGIFNGLTELNWLYLRDLNITDLPINILSTATELQTLVISYNRFTQYRPEWFVNLKRLSALHLDFNNAPIPANLFQPITSLRYISLQNCSISVVYPQWFSTLTLLNQVDLQLNNINQIPDNTFANTISLRVLRISGNKLNAISSKWFSTAALQSITEISADSNKINAIDPLFFQQATSLWIVSLYNNTCYNGPKITDFLSKRSTYIPGFQTCTDNFATAAPTNPVNYCGKDIYCAQNHIACNNTGAFGATCPAGASVIPMSADIVALILQRHNTARKNIANGLVSGYSTANRMIEMSWDSELASFAELAAKTCIFDHLQCWNTAVFKFAGQNIAEAYVGNNKNSTVAFNEMFDMWYNEYVNCNMTQIDKVTSMNGANGKTCGHFTQIVMANSMKVGCGMINYIENSYSYDYLVCNYAQTNMYGWPVYTVGAACTGCKSGCSVTYPGLCNTSEVVTW